LKAIKTIRNNQKQLETIENNQNNPFKIIDSVFLDSKFKIQDSFDENFEQTTGPPEKTGLPAFSPPENSHEQNFPPEESAKAGENPPVSQSAFAADSDLGDFSRDAALHPGRAPPLAEIFEKIRGAWNQTRFKIRLPECRIIALNLNCSQREIFLKALRDYTPEEIVNAVENYFWMRAFSGKCRMTPTYASLFTFLDKALPSFSEDDVFDNNFVLEEFRNKKDEQK
jgi:hypothetical protein